MSIIAQRASLAVKSYHLTGSPFHINETMRFLDLREATREAVRQMIVFLGVEYGLDKAAAYMLCSVAGDLRMHEVVGGISGL